MAIACERLNAHSRSNQGEEECTLAIAERRMKRLRDETPSNNPNRNKPMQFMEATSNCQALSPPDKQQESELPPMGITLSPGVAQSETPILRLRGGGLDSGSARSQPSSNQIEEAATNACQANQANLLPLDCEAPTRENQCGDSHTGVRDVCLFLSGVDEGNADADRGERGANGEDVTASAETTEPPSDSGTIAERLIQNLNEDTPSDTEYGDDTEGAETEREAALPSRIAASPIHEKRAKKNEKRRLVPWTRGRQPFPPEIVADPLPPRYVKQRGCTKINSDHQVDGKEPRKKRGRPKKNLVPTLNQTSDHALLTRVLQCLRNGEDPATIARHIDAETKKKLVSLPTIEKLSRIPEQRVSSSPRVVTTGSDFIRRTRNYGSFCWTAKDAIKFNSCMYDHKFSFVALVMAWAKVNTRHYWRDCRLTVQVVASSLDYSVTEYISLRGWTVRVEDDQSVVVEYRKLKECLARSNQVGRYIELYAMIGRCVSQIEDDRRWEEAAIIVAADKVRNKIARLSHAFHTAHVIIKELFWPVLPCAATKARGDELVDFVDAVFMGCKTRKEIISSCHCILATFPSIDKVLEEKDALKEIVSSSKTSFLSKIREKNALSMTNQDRFHGELRALLGRIIIVSGSATIKNPAQHALDIVRFKTHNEYFVLHPECRPDFWPWKGRKPAAGDTTTPPPPPPPLPANEDKSNKDDSSEDEMNNNATATMRDLTEDIVDSPPDETETVCRKATPKLPPVGKGSVLVAPKELAIASYSHMPPGNLPTVYVLVDHAGYRARTHNFKISPGEFYSICGLRQHPHGMVFAPPLNKMVSTTSIPIAASHMESNFTVLRSSHKVWLEHFGDLRLDFDAIVGFVLDNYTNDSVRDKGGYRVDFGNCGRSWHPRDPSSGLPTRPFTLVGLGVFGEHNSRVRRQIGRVLDRMQLCLDHCCKINGDVRCFSNTRRTAMFAAKLRESLGARVSRFEWVTIQLKCISTGDETVEHRDHSNCNWKGYDRTTAFCVSLVDSIGRLWSLKILGNSRKVAGDYLRSRVTLTDRYGTSPITQLVSSVRVYLNRVQESYNRLVEGRAGDLPALALRPQDVFLDEETKYTSMTIGASDITIQFVHTAAAVSRDFWLSPGVHWLHRWRLMGKSRSELITLAWLCSYQVSWYKFWAVMPSVRSSWDVEQRFREEFGSFFGGMNPRFSPPKFGGVYELFGRTPNEDRDRVVKMLEQLLEWVEREGDTCTTKDFKELLRGRSSMFRTHNVELAEFRLTVFVQLSVLSGLVSHGCGVLTKSYPVKERGSFQQLVDCHVREEDHEIALELLSYELGLAVHRGDMSECMCCESRQERGHIKDALFRGMNLYHLLWDPRTALYKSHIKAFNSREWVPLLEFDANEKRDATMLMSVSRDDSEGTTEAIAAR